MKGTSMSGFMQFHVNGKNTGLWYVYKLNFIWQSNITKNFWQLYVLTFFAFTSKIHLFRQRRECMILLFYLHDLTFNKTLQCFVTSIIDVFFSPKVLFSLLRYSNLKFPSFFAKCEGFKKLKTEKLLCHEITCVNCPL